MATASVVEDQVFLAKFSDVVRDLATVLGGRTVAVIGGVNKTSAVGEWMRGERTPRGVDAERRLRLAYQVVSILRDRLGDDETVRAWMLGANWHLKDQSPIAVIARGPIDQAAKAVLGTTREFVAQLS